MAENYDTMMQAAMKDDDWSRFAEANPEAVKMLEFAKEQYKTWLKEEYGTD